jgi:multiple sugar transport system permease protein
MENNIPKSIAPATNVKLSRSKRPKGSQIIWYVFLFPAFFGILCFMVYPILESLRLSLFHATGFVEKFAGLSNYKDVLTSKVFWNSVYNTFYIGIFQMIITIPLGFIFASMINTISFAKNFFKVIFFLPNVTAIVAAAMIFLFVLHPDMGILNYALVKLHLPKVLWLANPSTAKWGIILLGTWHWIGFVVIICLANLQAISPELYEASTIDGANGMQQWLFITIPNMAGTFAFLLITGWIGALQRFNEIYVIGGATGSPNRSIQTVVSYIYEYGFTGNEFGIASAATYVLFVIILIFTLFNLKITKMKL